MLIDSHCHLPKLKNRGELVRIITEAKQARVEKFVNIGTSTKDNPEVIKVAEAFEDVYATVGIYPHEDQEIPIPQLQEHIENLLSQHKKIVAIGECGLDIVSRPNVRPLNSQVELFEMQIALAQKYNKPLSIHNRNADTEILTALKKYPDVSGVFHCFSSTWDFAQKALDLGFYLSFSGMITYPANDFLREVVKKVPNDRFLLETDSPYLPPQKHRGQPNQPKYVRIIAEKAAQIKEIPFEEFCACSWRNIRTLFGL